jgi:hypothetical protein
MWVQKNPQEQRPNKTRESSFLWFFSRAIVQASIGLSEMKKWLVQQTPAMEDTVETKG